VLILSLVAVGQQTIGLVGGALVIALSLVLAISTHHLVERPVLRRAADVRTGYRLGALGATTVLLMAVTWHVVGTQQGETAELGDEAHPGAHALLTGAVEPAPLLPPPVSVVEDWVCIERWDCTPMAAFPMDVCTQPVAATDPVEEQDTPEPPARRIVVVGDSHAQQLTGALIPIAQQHNWQLTTIIRGACPFSTASEVVPDEPDCHTWNAARGRRDHHPAPRRRRHAGQPRRAGWADRADPTRVRRAVAAPRRARHPRARLARQPPLRPLHPRLRPEPIRECRRLRGEPRRGLRPVPALDRGARPAGNVSFIDIADTVCDPDRCPPVIGNVLVYLDDNHLTATYSTSIADLLADRIHTALGW